jgi:hypothetical protein
MAPPALHRPRAPGGAVAALGIALLATTLGHARLAAAQVGHVPLTWNAPASCPAAEAVLADIQRNLADSGDPSAPFVAVVNVLGSKGGPWQASLRIEARGGFVDRRFVAESCEAIASAAALIIALSAESGANAVSPPPPARAEPKEPAAPSAAEGEPRGWRRAPMSAGFGGIVDGTTLPGSPLMGVEGLVGANWTLPGWHLRLLVGGTLFPSHAVTETDVQATFRMGLVTGRGCMSARVPPVELGLCVGAEVAALHSSGTGYDFGSLATSTQFWPSPVGAALASWAVNRRVAVFARADLAGNFIRRNFHPSGNEVDLYTVPALSARATLGIELEL